MWKSHTRPRESRVHLYGAQAAVPAELAEVGETPAAGPHTHAETEPAVVAEQVGDLVFSLLLGVSWSVVISSTDCRDRTCVPSVPTTPASSMRQNAR
nr:hypothetical protein GCM10020241_01380 [Streptoalloteichus tenebrarius]